MARRKLWVKLVAFRCGGARNTGGFVAMCPSVRLYVATELHKLAFYINFHLVRDLCALCAIARRRVCARVRAHERVRGLFRGKVFRCAETPQKALHALACAISSSCTDKRKCGRALKHLKTKQKDRGHVKPKKEGYKSAKPQEV